MIKKVISLLMFGVLSSSCTWASVPVKPVMVGGRPTLYGSISNRPTSVFGRWEVHAYLPNRQNSSIIDIWDIYDRGDVILVTNPNTGASTVVNKNKMVDNCLKFHYNSDGGSETVKISFKNKSFSGEDLSIYKNKSGRTTMSKYKITGFKLP